MQNKDYNPTGSDPAAKEVSRLLVDLTKIIKIISMYPEGNPLPSKLKESFSERFVDLIKEQGQLQFFINQGEIRFRENLVYKDDSVDESLALMLHNSGITEIAFGPDYDFQSSNLFFKTMKAFINKEPGAGDLINLFWQSNIPGFEYSTVEDLILREYNGGVMVQDEMESDDSFIRGQGRNLNDSDKIIYSNIFLDDELQASTENNRSRGGGGYAVEPGQEIPGAALVRDERSVFFDEVSENAMGLNPMPQRTGAPLPDTALILNEAFAMDQIDLDMVERILRQDNEFNMTVETVALLREMLCQEREFSEFIETLASVEKTQSEFVRLGYLKEAGRIIELLQELVHSPDLRPEWKGRISGVLALLGGKDNLDILGGTLNRNPQIDAEEIDKYLSHFGWEVLTAATGLLGELENRQHREALCAYLERTGGGHIDIIARGIYDRRWFVVRNTVSILAGIGGEKAYAYLEKATNHEDSRVRLQVVKGLQQNKESKKSALLSRLVWDRDEVIREAALETIMMQSPDVQLEIVVSVINHEHFPKLDRAMQEQMLILYSQLAGEQAVGLLLEMTDGWKAVRSTDREIYREMAFRALGNNKSEKAEKALLKFNRAWNKNIRRMAAEAIAARRRFKYGGD
jgi:HEAT repeat protein